LAFVLGAAALGLVLLSRDDDADPSRIPVLAYHGITTDSAVVEGAADQRFFDVRLPAFREQMRYLDDAGYDTITPTQYKKWVYGEEVRAARHARPRAIRLRRDDVRRIRIRER
jgi:hypothetical protein